MENPHDERQAVLLERIVRSTVSPTFSPPVPADTLLDRAGQEHAARYGA